MAHRRSDHQVLGDVCRPHPAVPGRDVGSTGGDRSRRCRRTALAALDRVTLTESWFTLAKDCDLVAATGTGSPTAPARAAAHGRRSATAPRSRSGRRLESGPTWRAS